MQTNQNIHWDELKSQYYHNLMTLQTSILAAHNSVIEMSRIYSQVMTKAEEASPYTIRKFIDTWLNKMNVENMKTNTIRTACNKIQNGANPSISDLKDFELALQRKFHEKSIALLTEYKNSMQSFYDAWKQMWPN